jgi:NADPH2:quinone reductase
MTKAIRIDQPGGPEQLKLVDVTVGDPGPGESASATMPWA